MQKRSGSEIVLLDWGEREEATDTVRGKQFLMCLPGSLKDVGNIILRHVDNRFALKYMGHISVYTHVGYRRRGYATAAINRVLQEARRLGMKRLIATCRANNIAAERTFRKTGFKYVATVDVPDHSFLWRCGFKQVKRFSRSLTSLDFGDGTVAQMKDREVVKALPDLVQTHRNHAAEWKDHDEGFEKERLFDRIFDEVRTKCPALHFDTLEWIIKQVCPEFVWYLFEKRPCVRRLKYLGTYAGADGPKPQQGTISKNGLKVGAIYESTTYNGGSYTIRGLGKIKAVHASLFERVGPEIDHKKAREQLEAKRKGVANE